jgi:hypothetical protein
MFRATRRMDTGGPRHYRLLAEILATDLAGNRDAEAKALAAGHAWGVQLKPPASTTADRLDPFVEPDLCLVQFARQVAAT